MTLLERMERQAVLLNQPRELPLSVREHLAHAGILRFLGLPQPEMYDAHANFAYSLVATAPSPATSGTSLVVTAADGAKFPAAPFNAVVWPTAVQPSTSNAEIVRVTVKSTDTFTITRTQEGTSARSIVVGDQIAEAITAKTITDIETATSVLSRSVQVGGSLTIASSSSTSREMAAATGGPGTGGFDLTVAAVTGDYLLISINVNWVGLNTSQQVGIDIGTIVSGSVVNWIGQSAGAMVGTNDGLAFMIPPAGTNYWNFAVSVPYVVQSGDISSGNVTLRPYYGSTATFGLIGRSVANGPLIFGVTNLKH